MIGWSKRIKQFWEKISTEPIIEETEEEITEHRRDAAEAHFQREDYSVWLCQEQERIQEATTEHLSFAKRTYRDRNPQPVEESSHTHTHAYTTAYARGDVMTGAINLAAGAGGGALGLAGQGGAAAGQVLQFHNGWRPVDIIPPRDE